MADLSAIYQQSKVRDQRSSKAAVQCTRPLEFIDQLHYRWGGQGSRIARRAATPIAHPFCLFVDT
jgi:hypothetical protein